MSKRMKVITTILAIVMYASIGLASTVQQSDTTTKQDTTAKQDKTMKADHAGSNNARLDSSDKRFIMEVAHGGMMEVHLGKLASERASSAEVKQFAQRMVDDHSKANDELMQLASSKGVSMPQDANHSHSAAAGAGSQTADSGSHKEMMDPKHKAASDKLSRLSGADFDREYMRMMVKDHAKTVEKFEREAAKGKDPDVKAWAAKTLPTVREHLQMARDLNAKTDATSGKDNMKDSNKSSSSSGKRP